jgi:hypothetical protein
LRDLKCSCCSRGQCCHGRTAKSPDAGQLEFRMSVTPGSADYENQQVSSRTEFPAPTGLTTSAESTALER